MKNRISFSVLAAGLFVSLAAQAVGPKVTARFLVEDRETHEYTAVTAARMDQYVCLDLQGVLTPDGDHILELKLYDGLGREVYLARGTITSSNLNWGDRNCYGFNREHDAPGTWWYVTELDGEPLSSESIEIAAAGASRAVAAPAAR